MEAGQNWPIKGRDLLRVELEGAAAKERGCQQKVCSAEGLISAGFSCKPLLVGLSEEPVFDSASVMI